MLDNQHFMNHCLLPFLDYLILDFFYSGGYVFYTLECIYYNFFDYFFRQSDPKRPLPSLSLTSLMKNKDWENPMIVGRNRRLPHTQLRSFSSVNNAISYWNSKMKYNCDGSDSGGSGGSGSWKSGYMKYCDNIYYITNNNGSSNDDGSSSGSSSSDSGSDSIWDFCLVGCPEDIPVGWYKSGSSGSGSGKSDSNDRDIDTPTTTTTAETSSITISSQQHPPTPLQYIPIPVPSHWQLLGFDIPQYTNTGYPFRFNPPYVRR